MKEIFEVVVAMFLVIIYLSLGWLFGAKISITVDDETIGYIRWFTFQRIK